jgi:hypothetical protein
MKQVAERDDLPPPALEVHPKRLHGRSLDLDPQLAASPQKIVISERPIVPP